jgi:L-asparaginase
MADADRCGWARMSALPKVAILSLGGTIASAPSEGTRMASPVMSASDISASVPGLSQVAELELRDLARLPSIDVTFDLARLVVTAAREAEERGCTGVVVTQGTDTLEEMAFTVDLLHGGAMPIAFTGAMRHAGMAGNDGPANLLDAVRAVCSPAARGLGCLVVLNEEVHAARAVRKLHTSSPAAFASPAVGPIGWIVEGIAHLRDRPFPRVTIEVAEGATIVRPPLVKQVFDDDGWWLARIRELRVPGLVVEAMGGGHVPSSIAMELATLAPEIPIVLTSRTGGGEVLQSTYGGFPGSESMLIEAGLIPAGSLDSLKARIALALLLTAGADRDRITAAFAMLGSPARST